MWVIKPAAPSHANTVLHLSSWKPVKCRICKCNIPQWFFENATRRPWAHPLGAKIVDCNNR